MAEESETTEVRIVLTSKEHKRLSDMKGKRTWRQVLRNGAEKQGKDSGRRVGRG